MVSLSLGRRLAVVAALFALVNGLPSSTCTDVTRRDVAVERRDTPSPPHWVAYEDRSLTGNGPPDASAIKGFNVFNLAFLLTEGPWDQVQVWSAMTADQRATVKSQYAAAGIKLLVSVFGASDQPTSSGIDPVAFADTVSAFVLNNDLDGVDVDYEDLPAFDLASGAENWLISFTKQLRTKLPQGQYILTHAPLAPWFSPSIWGGGGYLKVDQQVGDLIDWYNIQFYNQGISEYTTCDGLLTTSSSTWPETSVFEIAANGVPLNKLVIGKPAGSGDANNGFMDAATLATCVASAKAKGWSAGAMVWQYPDGDESWIATVRGSAFPV